MNGVMHRAIALTAILVTGAALPIHSSPQLQIAGLYLCEGIGAAGSEYRGFVEIVPHGNAFFVAWHFPESGRKAEQSDLLVMGVGLVSGGWFSVSYYGQDVAGLAVYKIEEATRRLVGQWTLAGGDGGVYTETLTQLATLLEPDALDPEEDTGSRLPRLPILATVP